MFQPVREYVLRYATRQAGALAIAGLLAAPLIATQGFSPVDARTVAPPRAGTAVAGPARVIDGDTLEIAGVKIRLEGIDAPETGQTCGKTWLGTWPCGQEATSHVERLVRDREVKCESRGTDVYGRMLGVCVTAGLEINADLVRNGLAWAFVKYSTRYVEMEAEARALKLGIWQGKSQPAWEWRAERWSAAAATERAEAPSGCVIKGNITRSGHVYHMPWSPFYGRTRIDTSKGERWFCTEAEALAAGWRPAYAR